jgi:hypothetical protein
MVCATDTFHATNKNNNNNQQPPTVSLFRAPEQDAGNILTQADLANRIAFHVAKFFVEE